MSQIVFRFERASKGLHYTATYAESDRAICKGCEENITKDELKLGILMQVYL